MSFSSVIIMFISNSCYVLKSLYSILNQRYLFICSSCLSW